MLRPPPFLEVLLISLLVACAPAVTPTPIPTPELAGTEWQLISYGPAEAPVTPVGSTPITLAFRSDTELGGSAGCNSYFGSYTLLGETFTVTGVGSTEMACPEEGVMKQESAYLRQLSDGGLLSVSDEALTITNANSVLKFERVLPPPPAALKGTLWRLETFEQGEVVSSVLTGTEITLTFADNKASGFSGCNWFSAEYSVNGSRLELGLIQQTVRACLEPGVEEQERAFAEAFRTVTEYAIDGDRLTLTHAGGRLHFRAASSP
jgi:heat shock protein HslJ